MYDFQDKGGRHVAMRPENTAGVVRAMIQHKLLVNNDPQLLYYIGPMFRYERMQAGRYRQFWQIGAESFGVATPESEAESLVMLFDFLGELGLRELRLSINSVGTPPVSARLPRGLPDLLRGASRPLLPRLPPAHLREPPPGHGLQGARVPGGPGRPPPPGGPPGRGLPRPTTSG